MYVRTRAREITTLIALTAALAAEITIIRRHKGTRLTLFKQNTLERRAKYP
jgi:hypothetical protein